MEGKYIIGIDAGTSKIKSVLFDDKGNELYVASEDVKLIYPAPGLVEQDMNEAWESTFRTVKELLANVNVNKADIAAIAITGQADGTWLIGEDGEPVCNSYNWTDSRALSKCIEWIMSGKDMEESYCLNVVFPDLQVIPVSNLSIFPDTFFNLNGCAASPSEM